MSLSFPSSPLLQEAVTSTRRSASGLYIPDKVRVTLSDVVDCSGVCRVSGGSSTAINGFVAPTNPIDLFRGGDTAFGYCYGIAANNTGTSGLYRFSIWSNTTCTPPSSFDSGNLPYHVSFVFGMNSAELRIVDRVFGTFPYFRNTIVCPDYNIGDLCTEGWILDFTNDNRGPCSTTALFGSGVDGTATVEAL